MVVNTTLSGVISIEKPAHNGGALVILWYTRIMGNTVGSTSANFCNFFVLERDAYILGLWCADSYWWSSSVGLSNTDSDIMRKFRTFLERFFPKERIKHNRNHLFVNSRPLLREFRQARWSLGNLRKKELISAYFAGRFDGDGSVDKDLKKDCRIVYGGREEAQTDKFLLRRIGFKRGAIYYYKSARTFCLYISRYESKKFLKGILPYSVKLQKLALVPRRDLVS